MGRVEACALENKGVDMICHPSALSGVGRAAGEITPAVFSPLLYWALRKCDGFHTMAIISEMDVCNRVEFNPDKIHYRVQNNAGRAMNPG